MGVYVSTDSNGKPCYTAEYRNTARQFSIARYGAAEALRLAQLKFAELGASNTRGRAFSSESNRKKFKIAPNICFYWKRSEYTDKAYPVLCANISTDDAVPVTKSVKRALTKHGIKNAVAIMRKHLTDAAYPVPSEPELIDNVRAVLLKTYTAHSFDLKTIPDFY